MVRHSCRRDPSWMAEAELPETVLAEWETGLSEVLAYIQVPGLSSTPSPVASKAHCDVTNHLALTSNLKFTMFNLEKYCKIEADIW